MSGQTATVRIGSSLRFLLPVRHRHGVAAVPVDGTSSLGHVIETLGVPRTEVGVVLVDVSAPERPQHIAHPRFVLDVHLGALARRMRLLGIDVAYSNDATDDDLVAQADRQQRVLLTQDRGLLRRRALVAGGYCRVIVPTSSSPMHWTGSRRRFARGRAAPRATGFWNGSRSGGSSTACSTALAARTFGSPGANPAGGSTGVERTPSISMRSSPQRPAAWTRRAVASAAGEAGRWVVGPVHEATKPAAAVAFGASVPFQLMLRTVTLAPVWV
jgi:hypothetical protein